MATLQIPVRSDILGYKFLIRLEGVDYDISFRFNDRSRNWYMSFPGILDGIRLARGRDILRQFRYIENLPPGEFIVFQTVNNDVSEPNELNFGSEIVLLYQESE